MEQAEGLFAWCLTERGQAGRALLLWRAPRFSWAQFGPRKRPRRRSPCSITLGVVLAPPIRLGRPPASVDNPQDWRGSVSASDRSGEQ